MIHYYVVKFRSKFGLDRVWSLKQEWAPLWWHWSIRGFGEFSSLFHGSAETPFGKFPFRFVTNCRTRGIWSQICFPWWNLLTDKTTQVKTKTLDSHPTASYAAVTPSLDIQWRGEATGKEDFRWLVYSLLEQLESTCCLLHWWSS